MGIPPGGTEASNGFWAAFWPALYSGALYSVITGLIVGLVITWNQRLLETRRSRRLYEREISIARQRLREAVLGPERFVFESAIASAPLRAFAVMAVVRECPIQVWIDAVPKQRDLLSILDEFQSAFLAFAGAAANLDHELVEFARQYNADHRTISANDPPIVGYVLGRMQGFEDREILPWISFDGGREPWAFVSNAFSRASENARIVSMHAEYSVRRRAVGGYVERLRAALNAP